MWITIFREKPANHFAQKTFDLISNAYRSLGMITGDGSFSLLSFGGKVWAAKLDPCKTLLYMYK